MQRSGNQIDKLHGLLSIAFREVLARRLKIGSSDGANWKHMKPGKERAATFQFVSADDSGISDYADRSPGKGCPVVRIVESADQAEVAWAAWYEVWEPLGDQSFELLRASWTFFWGAEARVARQLFRADWDNPRCAAQDAPQPHWNITGLGRSVDALIDEAVSISALKEQGLYGRPGVIVRDLSKLHFGMAGWSHSSQHPSCWQRDLSDLPPGDLVGWAKSALQHTMCELRRAL
jgi:hypothetical protein